MTIFDVRFELFITIRLETSSALKRQTANRNRPFRLGDNRYRDFQIGIESLIESPEIISAFHSILVVSFDCDYPRKRRLTNRFRVETSEVYSPKESAPPQCPASRRTPVSLRFLHFVSVFSIPRKLRLGQAAIFEDGRHEIPVGSNADY